MTDGLVDCCRSRCLTIPGRLRLLLLNCYRTGEILISGEKGALSSRSLGLSPAVRSPKEKGPAGFFQGPPTPHPRPAIRISRTLEKSMYTPRPLFKTIRGDEGVQKGNLKGCSSFLPPHRSVASFRGRDRVGNGGVAR